MLSAVLAGLALLVTLVGARTAPQEAAGFAMAVAIAVVPYVFVRAVIAFAAPDPADALRKLLAAIEKNNQPK